MYSDSMQHEPPPRKVFLGMPGYGKQTSDAGRALWRACANMANVEVRCQIGSLLASNFNQLWCAALNLVHEGKRVDYFAMLHDDIGAPDGWLDTLIDELESKQLDVLGVAVPIKDPRGMTSMALAKLKIGPSRNDPSKMVWTAGTESEEVLDHFLPYCRLSIHDVYELPETFTSDDLGRLLLLNTGCWVAKFDMKWATKVHFQIHDRIVFNTPANRYQSQTDPEDWNFSRQLHEIGTGPTAHLPRLRIGATRKIPVIHQGEAIVHNKHPWGTNVFDSECVNKSPVPGAFPREIPGWLLPAEGKALAELARGKRVLEIGSYCGLSTVCMARTAEHVTAVDYFDGRGTGQPRNTLEAFQNNIARYGLTNVETCHPDAVYPLAEYDVAFIDGAHDAASVRCDVIRACEVLADDGLLAFHDYRSPIDPDVTEVVDELIERGGELISTHESVAVLKPPASILQEV